MKRLIRSSAIIGTDQSGGHALELHSVPSWGGYLRVAHHGIDVGAFRSRRSFSSDDVAWLRWQDPKPLTTGDRVGIAVELALVLILRDPVAPFGVGRSASLTVALKHFGRRLQDPTRRITSGSQATTRRRAPRSGAS
jgi:hypothetical protein